MGVRLATQSNNVQVNSSFPAAAETVAATVGPVNLALDNAPILLVWWFRFVTGASSTALLIRLRRGTTTAGVQIGQTLNVPTSGGNAVRFSGMYVDFVQAGAGLVWCLTLAFTGATGSGIMSDVAMAAIVL